MKQAHDDITDLRSGDTTFSNDDVNGNVKLKEERGKVHAHAERRSTYQIRFLEIFSRRIEVERVDKNEIESREGNFQPSRGYRDDVIAHWES